MTEKHSFGQSLRVKRISKGISLRKFAELVGVSAAYLSQVEHDNVDPPTADRVKRMADLIGENSDEWIGLAGRVPEDLPEIFRQQPTGISELLREASGLKPEQLREVTKHIRGMKAQANKMRRKPK